MDQNAARLTTPVASSTVPARLLAEIGLAHIVTGGRLNLGIGARYRFANGTRGQ